MTDLAEQRADLATHHIEGFAVHGAMPFDVPLVSHICDNLWTGGCRDGVRLPDDFAHVVSLYTAERYVLGPATHRVTMTLHDSSEDPGEGAALYELARKVNAFRGEGKTLVHCQAGLNRSSLITALALIVDGAAPDDAIELLRARRSPAVLCNATFERWLRNRG